MTPHALAVGHQTADRPRNGGMPADAVVLRADDGTALPLDPGRWHADPTPEEQHLLDSLPGPVLDVGCGPGRLVLGLAHRGTVVLGVDPAPAAVAICRSKGAPVLQKSVFDPLPGQGRWRTIILADGNIGIGGDPARLLRRCRDLLAQDGTIVVEVEAPGSAPGAWHAYRARLERGSACGPWFAWHGERRGHHRHRRRGRAPAPRPRVHLGRRTLVRPPRTARARSWRGLT